MIPQPGCHYQQTPTSITEPTSTPRSLNCIMTAQDVPRSHVLDALGVKVLKYSGINSRASTSDSDSASAFRGECDRALVPLEGK